MPTPRDRLVLEAIRTHGRLTADQVRRLFFRRNDGGIASKQAVSARLLKLTTLEVLEPAVVNGGRGAGPYAYGLAKVGHQLLTRLSRVPRGRSPRAVWHMLEIAEFRVRLQLELEKNGGGLVEWIGESSLRGLLFGRRDWPIPDALVHWRLTNREGAFLLEWDRGTETLAVLTAKLRRYVYLWQVKGHREMVPGLGLRPRLVISLASEERRARIERWIQGSGKQHSQASILLGVAAEAFENPLANVWWRSDTRRIGSLTE